LTGLLGPAAAALAGLLGDTAQNVAMLSIFIAGAAILVSGAFRDAQRSPRLVLSEAQGLKVIALGAVRALLFVWSVLIGAGAASLILEGWLHLLPEPDYEPEMTGWASFVLALFYFTVFGAPLGVILSIIGAALGLQSRSHSRP